MCRRSNADESTVYIIVFSHAYLTWQRSIHRCDSFSKLLIHATNWSPSHSISKNLSTCSTQSWRANRIVLIVKWNINLSSILSINQIVMCIRQCVYIFASQLLSCMSCLITSPKICTFSWPLIFLINDIVSGTALVCITNLVLTFHAVNPLFISALFIFHILPSL